MIPGSPHPPPERGRSRGEARLRRHPFPRWLLLAAALGCAGPRAGGEAAPDPSARAATGALAAAEVAQRQGRLEEAAALYEEAARADPRDVRPLVGLARARVATARLPEAAAALDRAVAVGDGPDVRFLRGRVWGLLRRFDEAAEELSRATSLDPARAAAWAALAAVQANRGDDVEAERAFAALAALEGTKAAAEQYWTQLLSMPPDRDAPQESLERCTRGAAALREGRFSDAQREAVNGLRYAPRFAWCAAVLADATARLGNLARAEELLRGVIAAFPDALAPLRADAQARLATVLLDARGEPAEAVRLARAALAVRGERAGLLAVLARACEAAGDADCAREARARLGRRAPVAPPPPAAPEATRPLFPVLKGGKWGYIDAAGDLVVPPRFERAGPFAEGLAAVQLGSTHGYVDGAGALVLVPAFAPAGLVHRPFSGGLAAVRAGAALGYMDRRGELVVPARFARAEEFSEGHALVCQGGAGCGYVDTTGQFVIGPGLAGGGPLRGGVACATVMEMMGRARVALVGPGLAGAPLEYEGCGRMSEGLIAVRVRERWGYLDAALGGAIPPRFAWAGDFGDGLAPARDESGSCGYVGRDGRFVIPPRFQECHPFSDGRARVDLAAPGDADRVAFIDRAGEVVVEGRLARPRFDSGAEFARGLAAVSTGGEPFLAGSGPALGYIDTSGRWVWTPTR